MNINDKMASLLAETAESLGRVSENGASVCIIHDEAAGYNGEDMATILVTLADGSEFKTYSSSSPMSLRAYLQGFSHSLGLIAGGFEFKPNNETAKRRKRDSICPWKEESRKYRMRKLHEDCATAMPAYGRPLKTKTHADAATSPRFAAFRTRFKG